METMNENVMMEENVNNIVDPVEEPITGEVNDSETEATDLSTENEHSGAGLAAGIAIVAITAAAAAGVKKLVKKAKEKKQKNAEEETEPADSEPDQISVRKLTLKERVTGKIKVDNLPEEEIEG